jgi:hypothetical protein
VTKSGNVNIANAFGLPAGNDYSCPGATSACEPICYAGKLERVFKGMRVNVTHNFDLIKASNGRQTLRLLDELITEFEQVCDRKNAEKLFRIHHDGDFFSVRYASAWKAVMLAHPDVTFWAYTRSFDLVPIFEGTPNLTLYLSVDSQNVDSAIETHESNPWVKLAALGQTFDDAKALLSAFGAKGARCPELNGALPLISPEGSACKRCGLCINGRGNVLFSVSKK